ncbi:hypothetical protein [Tautonia marina]|uniref:hypothetical protein n=1 Tax=Tautonia marina TaxID=2653855 RepID=UPI001260DC48|nr:hypothetical protein [Tautonia marina]
MKRNQIFFSLCLFNSAVMIAAIMFLPRRTGFGFNYTSEFEGAIKHFFYSVPWIEVLGISVISALITAAIYLFAAGVRGRKPDSLEF